MVSASLITIPDVLDGQQLTGVTEVSPGASYGDLPSGVFVGKGLLELNLPAHIDSIGENSFRYNSIDSVDLSVCSDLKIIGSRAFKNNSLTRITWADGIESIGSWAYKVAFHGYEDYESTIYIVDENIEEDIFI